LSRTLVHFLQKNESGEGVNLSVELIPTAILFVMNGEVYPMRHTTEMDLFDLSFGKINILREDIAEVVIDEGVEIDAAMVEEFHQFLISYFEKPYTVLLNNINPHSYSFEAIINWGNLPEMKAMAAVAYSNISNTISNVLASFQQPDSNFQVFSNKTEALGWLLIELDRPNQLGGCV